MEHWTLCDVLRTAQENGVTSLSFIDAHAMAPLASNRTGSDDRFDRVQDSLPGQRSAYEIAWHQLVPHKEDGYPNSANFVRHIWEGAFSLVMCEVAASVIHQIFEWQIGVRQMSNIGKALLWSGDWRNLFHQGLPGPSNVGLPLEAVTLISFDPNMYDRHGPPSEPKRENMYPEDLVSLLEAVHEMPNGILVQLSTYSANNANSQGDVLQQVDNILDTGGFERVATTQIDGNMMSLIYAREVGWAYRLSSLGEGFKDWLSNV